MPLTTVKRTAVSSSEDSLPRPPVPERRFSMKMLLFCAVVSIFVSIAFSIFGNRDDRAEFRRAVTPVRIPIAPEPQRSIAASGAQS